MAGTATGRQRYRWLVLLAAAAILVVWFFTPTQDDPARSGSPSAVPSATSTDDETGFPPTAGVDPDSGLPYVAEASLPAEARDVLERIDGGGPFQYPGNDDEVFENREDLLPDQPLGYYREYTVPTPGVGGRGARRIVTGDGGEYYWTDDHYDSFSRIERSP